MIWDIDLDDLKARIPLEQYVATVLPLKKQGRHYAALCPWHQDSTPSFLITPERQRFHCFGCGIDGDLFDFIQRSLEVDLAAAIRIVAERAGIPIDDKPEDRARAALHQRLYDACAAAATRYHALLFSEAGAAARRYLEGRGITVESMRRFGLGWAPEGDRELAEYLVARGYNAQELLTAGLVVRSKEGDGTRPPFAGRLLFPVRDGRGRICGFSARLLGDGHPKYLNTPATPLYHKGRLLYGLDLAQDAIRQAGGAVVVEGYLDVVRAHQCGYRQVVGVGGTAVTPEQFLLLRRCGRITLALDGDPSGQHAQIKAGLAGQAAFAKEGKEVALHVALLPPEHDPDSLLASEPTRFSSLIAEAPLLMEHVYGQEVSAVDRAQPDWRGRVLRRLRPHLAILPFGLRAHYVRRLAADLQIDDGRLWTELDGGQAAPKQAPPRGAGAPAQTAPPQPRGVPRPPSWLPRIEPGNTASLRAAQDAAWTEGMRRAEEYALGLLVPHAPLDGDLLEMVRLYEPGTPDLAPYFATLAHGGIPDGADTERLVAAAQSWPNVPPEQMPALVLSTLRRAGTDHLRLAAEAGEAPPTHLAGALRGHDEGNAHGH